MDMLRQYCYKNKQFPSLVFMMVSAAIVKLQKITLFHDALSVKLSRHVFISICVKRWNGSSLRIQKSSTKLPDGGHIISDLRMVSKSYIWFHWNSKESRVEAEKTMANYENYFPLFSKITHIILKIFSQYGAME